MREPRQMRAASGRSTVTRTLDAHPDTLDFRDRLFEPTLVEVPTHIDLAAYRRLRVPLLDQGQEGACTGFGLATVAHYLLRRRRVRPERTAVSPRMLYELARRYDEWPGEDYSGSSARGAMKGWHKHGVCAAQAWPYRIQEADGQDADDGLTQARAADALQRPLGAYLRVNHKDLVALHCALAEVGILYATANVHAGWSRVGTDGVIAWPAEPEGGHAFAIVAYDADGFWIQNSWGAGWGCGGFARIGYDDWLANATDVWVARLGAPVRLQSDASAALAHSAAAGHRAATPLAVLRPHVVSLGNDGRLQPGGDWGNDADDLRRLVREDLPRTVRGWKRPHVLLYAHGGLVPARSAIQRLAEYRAALLDAEVFPISLVWHSDGWSTLAHLLQDALRARRPEGVLDAAGDFMLERLDDTLEVLARAPGKAMWDEMKENATRASQPGGGALMTLELLARLRRTLPFRLHLVGHSAGAILLAPLVRWLHRRGQPVDSCTLWAPACTMALFQQSYLPALQDGGIGRFCVFALDDKAEQADHCARLYNKSLLYLVSRSFEADARGPGTPLLGMARWLAQDAGLRAAVAAGRAEVVLCPNPLSAGARSASGATTHGSFDDDPATVLATLARMLEDDSKDATRRVTSALPDAAQRLRFHRSGAALRARREAVERPPG